MHEDERSRSTVPCACLPAFENKTEIEVAEEENSFLLILSEDRMQTAGFVFTSHLDSTNVSCEYIFRNYFSSGIHFLLAVIAQFVLVSKEVVWLVGTDEEE